MAEEKITNKTKLLLPVDVFGQPTDKSFVEVARKHGLKVLEDSCEAVGSEFDGAGSSLADGSVFAFYLINRLQQLKAV